MAEHPLCHRRVSQSFFPAMCFFFVKKEKENFGPRTKERKKERKKERTQSGEEERRRTCSDKSYLQHMNS